jgi:hypothetical protein
MTLGDLRKLSIRQQVKIHFRLQNGMECIVNEQGVAQVPGLAGVPAFNLEEELAGASEFLVEPEPPAAPRSLPRQQLTALAAAQSGTAPASEHEDE